MILGKKEKKDKKNKKEKEPQYYLSATNIKVLNYKVYYMKPQEKILYFLAAFLVGYAVGYLFYGGIGMDEYGNPTQLTHILNVVIPSIVGVIVGYIFLPVRTAQIINKRRKSLSVQFRDMLESLNTSLGAGKNVPDSFVAVREDMALQYDSDAFIHNELNVIISGIQNNQDIEDVLMDFGKRSGIKDIEMFANVFRISYRRGGNMKDIIRTTHSILKDKMEISEEIETVITSNKNELNVMMIMPVLLIAMIKNMSPEFGSNFASPSGIVSTTIAIAMFIGAYVYGKKVVDVKI